MSAILVGVVAGVIGIGIGYLIRKAFAMQNAKNAEVKAEKILVDAKSKQKELLLDAKDKAIKIIDEAKLEEKQRRNDLSRLQERLEKRETAFDQKILDLESKQQKLIDKAKEVESIKEKVNSIKNQQLEKLETISGLNKETAKDELLTIVESTSKDDLLSRMNKLELQNTALLEQKAKEVLALTIHRCSLSHAAEITTTTIDLPDDEMKGRIIGKEGRNIRTIERLTGCELVIDETPGVITASGFSPIRRHVAKRALEELMSDGRIHPGRIEEAVEKAKKEIAIEIKKAGEEACYELGITGIDPKLVQILGRLKFRTSYGQNVLMHSIEVARIAELLAREVGADITICKKGGLFHDIGKAVDHEIQGSHPDLGYEIMMKFGFSEDVAYMGPAHHEDSPKTLEGIVVKIADAISGGRPGARNDSYERYLQRLEDLENVAIAFDGIEKAYAIQAGREIRIFVKPDVVDDYAAKKLAQDIAHKIEEELRYPGEIKVTLIRENRIIEYAR